MPDNDTTPSAEDNGNQENWEARYAGLQKVVAKRDTDLHTTQAALDALRAEHDATLTELTDHRQKAIDASEDEEARATYEALRARFEPEPAKPIGNNPARSWADGSGDRNWRGRPHDGDSSGFPT